MTEKKYDIACVIGRFQGYHLGHQHIISKALENAELVVICVGTASSPRTFKDPFTYKERCEVIKNDLLDANAFFYPLKDYMYDDDKWAMQVKETIEEMKKNFLKIFSREAKNIAIFGHKKDSSSYYLDMFPMYDFVDTGRNFFVSATDVREEWFKETKKFFPDNKPIELPKSTKEFLENFDIEIFKNLQKEFKDTMHYRRIWRERAPYPVIFQTVDSVVMKSNHVLLVKRKHTPGRGLFALPGGFLNVSETLYDGAVRELKEETKLNIPEKVLRGSLVCSKRFDHPDRSLRGRTITEAFFFKLPNGKLDKVKGADDAEKACWVHIDDIHQEEMFEDHHHIISFFLPFTK